MQGYALEAFQYFRAKKRMRKGKECIDFPPTLLNKKNCCEIKKKYGYIFICLENIYIDISLIKHSKKLSQT